MWKCALVMAWRVFLQRRADAVERTGFAQGYGLAATTHLDTVLEKLQQLMKSSCARGAAFRVYLA